MKKTLFVLIVGSLMLSCQKNKETAEDQTTTTTPDSTAFTNQRNNFFSNLLAPTEAAAQLQATGAEFNASLMNDPKKYSQYTSNEVKAAANMGIYLSDLNYSVAYKQTANTKEYFTAAHELSKTVGAEQGTLTFLAQRYSDNIAHNDSAKVIIKDLLSKSTQSLQGTEREKVAGIAMAAYQIENLHLALGVIDAYPDDLLPSDARTVILVPIYKMVLGQKENIQTTYDFLKSFSSTENPNYQYYSTAFEELIAVYNRLNVDEKIAQNKGIELMNDAVMKELAQKVDAIRNKVTSAE
jgi:hypothetical protein